MTDEEIDKELEDLGEDDIAENGDSLDVMKEMFGELDEDVNNDGDDAAQAD